MFVAPAFATTKSGRRPASTSASIAAASASARIRSRSSTGTERTWSASNPSTCSARVSDEWLCGVTYTTAVAARPPAFASFAHASAVRFASDPPGSRIPDARPP